MIYIIEGSPRAGKTFWATMRAMEFILEYEKKVALREKEKNPEKKKQIIPIRVFSNYPIIFYDKLPVMQRILNRFRKNKIMPKVHTSFVWTEDFIEHGLLDAKVIIDEAYRYFSSRNFAKFTKETHTAFATNGHNTTDYYLIAQHHDRLDVIIREMVNLFIVLKKHTFPWSENPLWFTVKMFESEKHMDSYLSTKDGNYLYSSYNMLPKSSVKKAYDTHYFRTDEENIEYKTWYDEINKSGLQLQTDRSPIESGPQLLLSDDNLEKIFQRKEVI